MHDKDNQTGQDAVKRAQAAADTSHIGPGTTGRTTSGAAYQGANMADAHGTSSATEKGFGITGGLGYNDPTTTTSGYAPTDAANKNQAGNQVGNRNVGKTDVTPNQPRGT